MGGLRVTADMPEVIQEIVTRLTEALKQELTPKEFKAVEPEYYISKRDACCPGMDDPKEWRLGSDFEDGIHIVIYNLETETFFYRDPWTGRDEPIKGGKEEVIAHLKAWFYDI